MKLPIFTSWGYTWVKVPDDGTINDTVCHVFISGQCHSLAMELNSLTGWAIAAIFGSNRLIREPGFPVAPAHFAVKSPRGYLDINGLDADRRMMKAYKVPYSAPETITAEEIQANYKGWGYVKPNPARVKPFAESLLTEYKVGHFYHLADVTAPAEVPHD